MDSRRPIYQAGNYYHIYNRGFERSRIFVDEENYLFVLKKIKKYIRENNLSLIAYCLMPNHYHFLVRQDGELDAGLLPQRVFNSYTKAFNKRFGRSGSLFEGPYKVIQIQHNSHLLHLCRYIHANPVVSQIVEDLRDWQYSNYLEWIGARSGSLVDRDFLLLNFQSGAEYEAFVKDYIDTPELPDDVKLFLKSWGVRA